MLTEQTYSRAGVGMLRVVGDVEPAAVFTVADIAFAEFEREDGHIYGPLDKLQAVLILSNPSLAVQICETAREDLEDVARTLGLG